MEPINFVKGYNKVNPSDHPNSPPKYNYRRRTIVSISVAIFSALVIVMLIAALIHQSSTESAKSRPSTQSSSSADSLRAVCSVTRYPDSCFSSMSPLNTPPINDPLRFFNLSLHVSMIEVSTLKNLSGSKGEAAMKDCAELLDDSASQLVRSAELMRVGPGEKVLTEMNISDMKTWISAAMTDQETCLDGIEEMGLTTVDEFKMKVQKSQEYVSNTLAILNNIQSLFDKFGLTMP